MNIRMLTVMLAALAAGALNAAEAQSTGGSPGVVLPPPKVALPPLPADGPGIWRLHLEDCVIRRGRSGVWSSVAA